MVFVGFQAQGTTGRRIIEGAEKVRIFTEDVAVKAQDFHDQRLFPPMRDRPSFWTG